MLISQKLMLLEFIAPTSEEKDKLKTFDFDSDWNILMKVVDKIESYLADDCCIEMGYSSTMIPVIVGNDWPKDYIEVDGFNIVCEGKNRIEATGNACLNFVDWFNSLD